MIRYSETLTVQVQPGFRSLIDTAANLAGAKPTEWTRQALTAALRASGIDPVVRVSRSAGELYDRLSDGKTRWALVADHEVVSMSYEAAKPEDGQTWLPVVHEDSEPFDAAKHYRLKPEARIDGDRVVVTYPVVEKAEAV